MIDHVHLTSVRTQYYHNDNNKLRSLHIHVAPRVRGRLSVQISHRSTAHSTCLPCYRDTNIQTAILWAALQFERIVSYHLWIVRLAALRPNVGDAYHARRMLDLVSAG